MVYSFRNLLVSFSIIIVVVLLIVLRTFSTLRSQRAEYGKISQARMALQCLGPAIVNIQEFESVSAKYLSSGGGVLLSNYNAAIEELRFDSLNMMVLAQTSTQGRVGYLQLADIIHKMVVPASPVVTPRESPGTALGTISYRMALAGRFKEIATTLEKENWQVLASSYDESIDLTQEMAAFMKIISLLLALFLAVSFWIIYRDIKNRKKGEERLKLSNAELEKQVSEKTVAVSNSEKNLRHVLSSTTDVFYVIDKNYRITLINEAAEKNLRIRWGKAVSVGSNVLDLIPPGKYEETKNRFENVMRGEGAEYEVYQPEPVLPPWVLVTFTPVTDDLGNIVGASVTGKDISERKHAEEKLKRSEQQLLASIQNTPNVAVQWYNEKGEVLFWNPAAEFIFGWKADEAAGKTPDHLIFDDEENARFLSMLKQVAQSGDTVGPVEFNFHHKNGTAGNCISTIFAIPSIEGGQCFASMNVDVTGQKRIESELREAEAKFRNLVEQSLIGVYIIRDRTFAYVNPRFAEIFGYEPQELINTLPLEELVNPGDRKKFSEDVHAGIMKDRSSIHYEAKGMKKNGDTIYIEVFCSGTLYEGGPAIIGTLLDISERKKVEKEKEQVRYLLNERIKELTTLYRVSQVFHEDYRSVPEILHEIVSILPSGWQYPEVAAARIIIGDTEYKTPNFQSPVHRQIAPFSTPEGPSGIVEVVYVEKRPIESEDAFSPEERKLLNMVTEMLRIFLARQQEGQMNKKMQQEILDQKIQEQKTVTRAVLNAEERERNKIGRDLHDNVNQILASVKLYLKTAADKNAGENDELLHRSATLLDSAIEEIRLLSQSQVTPVKEIDLRELIQVLVERLNDSTSIRTVFNYEKGRTIPDDLKLNIYRIVQEQINNILKHADASEIRINILADTDHLHVSIEDNGKGFDPAKRRKGVGISNMINRVESFNGQLNITSSPGNGCRVELRLPY